MINSVNSDGLQTCIYPSNEAPAQTMVQDALVSGVGKELSLPDFAALALVCKAWQKMIQPNIEKKASGSGLLWKRQVAESSWGVGY